MTNKIPYVQATFGGTSFNCPFCNAYAKQSWYELYYHSGRDFENLEHSYACLCSHCGKYSIWYLRKMIHPDFSGVESPNDDLNEDIKRDYLEAASIVQKSPRGAVALLRLAIQKLCIQLGEKGKDLNTDIGNLVKKGLLVRVQQSLDALRVIGNEAVIPVC